LKYYYQTLEKDCVGEQGKIFVVDVAVATDITTNKRGEEAI
jgi:nitrogen regulatory protein PII